MKAILIAALALGACTSIPSDNPSHKAHVAGIPLLLAVNSSSTQVAPGVALTAAHAAPMDAKISTRYDAATFASDGVPAKTARPIDGELVTVYGSDLFGQPVQIKTNVIERSWVCEKIKLPIHVTLGKGTCTNKGMGYSYGFAVERNGIGGGFSGGGVYNAKGELLGMIIQVGIDTWGRDIAFAYYIQDLQKDLEF